MWDLLVVSRWRHCCHWRQLIGYCCACVVIFRNVKFSDSCLRMSNKFGTVSTASCFRRCCSETMTACSQTLCMICQVTKGAHRTVKSLVLSAWLMKGASMWVCREDHDNRLSSFVEVYILLHSVRVQVCVSFELCDVLQLLWARGSVADCWNIVQRSTLTGHSDVLLVHFLFLIWEGIYCY